MRNEIGRSVVLLGACAFLVAGCTGGKKTKQEINLLKTQVGGLTADVSRLSQETRFLQESLKEQEGEPGVGAERGGAVTRAGVYRTPSGFELRATILQQALRNAGYYQGSVDGKVGSGTVDAIKRFQQDNGLDVDGVCGRRTWGKLREFSEGAIK